MLLENKIHKYFFKSYFYGEVEGEIKKAVISEGVTKRSEMRWIAIKTGPPQNISGDLFGVPAVVCHPSQYFGWQPSYSHSLCSWQTKAGAPGRDPRTLNMSQNVVQGRLLTQPCSI